MTEDKMAPTGRSPSDEDLTRADEWCGEIRVTGDSAEGALRVSDLTTEIRRLRELLPAHCALDDLDVQERAGLIGVWLTPSGDGQMPVVSLELLGGKKRYARVWIDGRDQVEWGWVLNDKAICVWRDPDFSADPPGATSTEKEPISNAELVEKLQNIVSLADTVIELTAEPNTEEEDGQ